MPKPSARETVLDAYEAILIEQGPAGVTLDAVAARAAVSKGGLLYHFESKDALLEGLLERLVLGNDEDVLAARAADEGPVRYYLATSVSDATWEHPVHRTIMAVLPLTATDPRVRAAWDRCCAAWSGLLAEHVADPVTRELLSVLGDGLYLRAALGDRSPTLSADWDTVLTRLGAAHPPHDREDDVEFR